VAAALVTGASRKAGIAAAVALALARDGWALALTGYPPHDAREGWSSEPEELAAELGAAWYEDDLADPEAPARVLDAAEAAVGALTALVNVHAHSESGGLLEATPEQLERHWAVNARGTALLLAEFARRFRGEPGAGRIVNFTSGLPLAGELAYAASKGALEWITVSAAAELAPRGISVNAVDPGPTEPAGSRRSCASGSRRRCRSAALAVPKTRRRSSPFSARQAEAVSLARSYAATAAGLRHGRSASAASPCRHATSGDSATERGDPPTAIGGSAVSGSELGRCERQHDRQRQKHRARVVVPVGVNLLLRQLDVPARQDLVVLEALRTRARA
jgi:3-oxoacyl-[acyl-carrier protein] reductase